MDEFWWSSTLTSTSRSGARVPCNLGWISSKVKLIRMLRILCYDASINCVVTSLDHVAHLCNPLVSGDDLPRRPLLPWWLKIWNSLASVKNVASLIMSPGCRHERQLQGGTQNSGRCVILYLICITNIPILAFALGYCNRRYGWKGGRLEGDLRWNPNLWDVMHPNLFGCNAPNSLGCNASKPFLV